MKKKQFVVTIKNLYIRDIQIFTDATKLDDDFHLEDSWKDYDGDLFLGIVSAYSEDEALTQMSEDRKLPKEILGAQYIAGENDDYFEVIRWHEEDVYAAFDSYGIPPTEENLNIFLNSLAPKALHERSVEVGNEILDILVSDMKKEFNPLRIENEINVQTQKIRVESEHIVIDLYVVKQEQGYMIVEADGDISYPRITVPSLDKMIIQNELTEFMLIGNIEDGSLTNKDIEHISEAISNLQM